MTKNVNLEHSIFLLTSKSIKRVTIFVSLVVLLFLSSMLMSLVIKFGLMKGVVLMQRIPWLVILLSAVVMDIVFTKLSYMKAQTKSRKVQCLIDDPNYEPIEVIVKKPKFVWGLLAKSGGAAPRMAKDTSGKHYEVHFGDRLNEEFEANLYVTSSKWWIPSMEKYVVVPK